MRLYKTTDGSMIEINSIFYRSPLSSWDAHFHHDNLYRFLSQKISTLTPLPNFSLTKTNLLAPIQSQEVWGAGVTYLRSKSARKEESDKTGGSDFYERGYNAERPELFFKATPHRVVGSHQAVRIRKDSIWNVPEPELTLAVSSNGKIVGYTIGDDVSSRSIESENPLYLPQAKVYDACCALGPGILITEEPISTNTEIHLKITRKKQVVFEASVLFSQMKRKPEELVSYLFRDNSFPAGCFLMTGTGIVPSDNFTLQVDDQIEITIDGVGTLVNTVHCG